MALASVGTKPSSLAAQQRQKLREELLAEQQRITTPISNQPIASNSIGLISSGLQGIGRRADIIANRPAEQANLDYANALRTQQRGDSVNRIANEAARIQEQKRRNLVLEKAAQKRADIAEEKAENDKPALMSDGAKFLTSYDYSKGGLSGARQGLYDKGFTKNQVKELTENPQTYLQAGKDILKTYRKFDGSGVKQGDSLFKNTKSEATVNKFINDQIQKGNLTKEDAYQFIDFARTYAPTGIFDNDAGEYSDDTDVEQGLTTWKESRPTNTATGGQGGQGGIKYSAGGKNISEQELYKTLKNANPNRPEALLRKDMQRYVVKG